MGRKILIVDDEPVAAKTLGDALKRKGYEGVITANSGEEACQSIKKEKPDLILLDIMMPGMSGVETLREIKKIDPNLEVIMLTGRASTELEWEARKIRVSGFLYKELSPEVFMKNLSEILEEREEEKKPEKKKGLKILVIDDDPQVRDLLNDFLDKEGYDVSLASNGIGGLSKVKSEKPDLVLVDINMPEMDGLEVLKRVKEDNPSLTVIMISGGQDMETARKTLEMGAYDYITKPFDLHYLKISVLSKLQVIALDKSS